jgi:hypothetical protein
LFEKDFDMLYEKYDHNAAFPDKYRSKPVQIYLFCHDDIGDGARRFIYRDYLRDFMYELEQVFRRNIVIELHHRIPGMTDMSYQTESGAEASTLFLFEEQARLFILNHDLDYEHTFRYGLITRENFSDSLGGLAMVGRNFFMASLSGYQNIAHEVGHTFEATHEDAQVSFGIPPSQTYMHERNNPLYVKDYRFSDTNRQNMARFMDRTG